MGERRDRRRDASPHYHPRVDHRAREPARSTGSPEDLLLLAFDRPDRALASAEALLACSPTPFDASVAHQAIGLVQREFGELPAAIRHLRRALVLARRDGSPERAADVLATLGIALVHAGRSGAGLAALDEAVGLATGVAAARVRFRRAGALEVLGRHDDALRDLRAAVPVLRRARDDVWTARALTLRALIHLSGGLTGRADRDFATAERIYDDAGQRHESIVARHNRGLVAFRAGDLPAALALLDEADHRYRALGTTIPELAVDRCAVLLAAGLAQDALAAADAAAEELLSRRGQATRRAELLLLAARSALAVHDPAGAEHRAAVTVGVFAGQGRSWWQAHATLLLLHARSVTGPPTERLLAQAADAAEQLGRLGSLDAVQGHLLAGRIALALGRPEPARHHLETSAGARHRGPAAARASGWLAHALLAASTGRVLVALAACRRGLDLLDEHQQTLGASELRARVTAQGAELAELAQRTSLRAGRTRRLLVWSERWRATACAVPPVRPTDDGAAQVDLAALREITHRLDLARQGGGPVAALDRERGRLEERVRDRVLRTPGHRGQRAPLDVGALLDALGDTRLVEIVEVDGTLHALVCGDGRVRRIEAGRAADAGTGVEHARWMLRGLAYGVHAGRAEAVPARLVALGARLQAALLGAAARHLGDGPVVLVPPGRLHGVPWALLPALADRAHSVAPSAKAWLMARTTPAPPGGVVVVRGPGLGGHGSEVPAVAAMHPGALLLHRGAATAPAVLDALDGSALAHVAAHGEFRAGSPLFSSLHLDDGPLTVYDLEGLRRAPYRLVLPSCDSGQLQPVGADELLGLATALLPRGTAGLVASLVPVNDEATVPLMIALHEELTRGRSLGEALRHARAMTPDDPVHRATAWSFVALGAV